ncbi:MAG: hypothetical protein ABSC73_01475 [Acidimicrobiales bacterium]
MAAFSGGERVMGLVSGPGQAELALPDERHAWRVPVGRSRAAAGRFAEAFCPRATPCQAALVAGPPGAVRGPRP